MQKIKFVQRSLSQKEFMCNRLLTITISSLIIVSCSVVNNKKISQLEAVDRYKNYSVSFIDRGMYDIEDTISIKKLPEASFLFCFLDGDFEKFYNHWYKKVIGGKFNEKIFKSHQYLLTPMIWFNNKRVKTKVGIYQYWGNRDAYLQISRLNCDGLYFYSMGNVGEYGPIYTYTPVLHFNGETILGRNQLSNPTLKNFLNHYISELTEEDKSFIKAIFQKGVYRLYDDTHLPNFNKN